MQTTCAILGATLEKMLQAKKWIDVERRLSGQCGVISDAKTSLDLYNIPDECRCFGSIENGMQQIKML